MNPGRIAQIDRAGGLPRSTSKTPGPPSQGGNAGSNPVGARLQPDAGMLPRPFGARRGRAGNMVSEPVHQMPITVHDGIHVGDVEALLRLSRHLDGPCHRDHANSMMRVL